MFQKRRMLIALVLGMSLLILSEDAEARHRRDRSGRRHQHQWSGYAGGCCGGSYGNYGAAGYSDGTGYGRTSKHGTYGAYSGVGSAYGYAAGYQSHGSSGHWNYGGYGGAEYSNATPIEVCCY